MRVNGEPFKSIWPEPDRSRVNIIDQTQLPHVFAVAHLRTLQEAAHAIKAMLVRGAPLIGVTAAYGLSLALQKDASDDGLRRASEILLATRPTAVNLQWALREMADKLLVLPQEQRAEAAWNHAGVLAEDDIRLCEAMGDHGLVLIEEIARRKQGERVNILTHCNAGWLATVDWGTATAPMYKAQEAGIPIHVYVDETRPRNQGASLTAWELGQHGVPHTVIVDNAGGHLMQHGLVDLVIVGTDRTTASGDVCNKIGTYLKALAAFDNDVPFYVCAPSPSIDFSISDGLRDIPIEERSPLEVTHLKGLTEDKRIETIRITPENSEALNYAFDVTPARLVTGLITERGTIAANAEALAKTFPDR
ncbi:S-methyl-5-thioribose-1-phosphate isomerase [Beijerinckia indica]|uniref:Methylthioribose-1-phosphate isomerase n=1 Tax=Beijerinckia indica subsp. indica (strain ATCC 9039 / DSM 1715 / NCIMB 8712) TaxID=395963 RepID=B2IGD0_BEII9|nr:S-methyl-5-thioribose-1-phosphate isomerase [Beijerinckia indica]ACB94315.1 translation initiation factor, aIF-2BI family [Beijerinckia indica subsp. indica ATCC 9039]